MNIPPQLESCEDALEGVVNSAHRCLLSADEGLVEQGATRDFTVLCSTIASLKPDKHHNLVNSLQVSILIASFSNYFPFYLYILPSQWVPSLE